MLQYKLFRIHRENRENTLKNIKEVFRNENLWIINEEFIAIFYDYGVNDYKYVLKKMFDLKMSQLIITSNIILNFMEQVINRNSFVTNLIFAKSISPEDSEFINKSLRLINIEKDIEKKKILKKELFKELKWLTIDGCIDINYVETEVNCGNSIFVKVKLYNNGVILIENLKVKAELQIIFDSVKKEIR